MQTIRLTTVAILLGLTVGCQRAAPPPEEHAAVPVEVIVMIPDSLSATAVLSGVLKAFRAVDIVCEVSGEVIARHADVGDYVARNALLAQVDKLVPRENLNQAMGALLAAEARHEIARNDYVRDSTLHLSGDISASAHDNSRLAYAAARAELMSARAARELAARQLAETDIRTPFAGHVSRRYCDVGTYVSLGMPAFRVVDTDSLRLHLGVSQRNVVRLVPGSEVLITVDALGERTLRGRIRAISPEADELTRTFTVEVILANLTDHALRDGLVVRATLILDARRDVLAAPREAVLFEGGEGFVYVIDDSLASRRAVRLGSLIDGYYVVEAGLQAGDRLVVVGVQNLRDGVPIVIETVYTRATWQQEQAS
jgi:RND family efflux transporter MFP subunit